MIIILIGSANLWALVSPIRRNNFAKPLLSNCEDIKLVSQATDLYHHPLGIWVVNSRSVFQNLYASHVTIEVGFMSGFDSELIDSELVPNEFKNFKVNIDGIECDSVIKNETCPNFTERIGITWTSNDGTGSGFLNTWQMSFEPEEKVIVDVSFSFIVKQPPVVFDAGNDEAWYNDLMIWMRREHAKREEHDFVLPLNMGSFWALSVDTLLVRTYISLNWLGMEAEEERSYAQNSVYAHYYTEPIDLYSPEPVQLLSVTEDELETMNATELTILRHSFFAKYGRIFDADWLNLYFRHQPWYGENPYYHNWYLSDFDIENLKRVYNFEQKRKSHD